MGCCGTGAHRHLQDPLAPHYSMQAHDAPWEKLLAPSYKLGKFGEGGDVPRSTASRGRIGLSLCEPLQGPFSEQKHLTHARVWAWGPRRTWPWCLFCPEQPLGGAPAILARLSGPLRAHR